MRFDVITLFPDLFAPIEPGGYATRVRRRPGRRAHVAAARLRGRAASPRRRPPLWRRPRNGDVGRAAGAGAGGDPDRAGRSAPGTAGSLHAHRRAHRPAHRRRLRRRAGRGAAVRALRRHRPALPRSPRRSRAEPRRLRAVRAANCRLWRCSMRWRACRKACSAIRSRTGRTVSPPGCSKARITADPNGCPEMPGPCPTCCCRATTQPSRAGAASGRSS